MPEHRTVTFSLGGMLFEYDEEKNLQNIRKHGISFPSAARVFFDYDRIELYDAENSAGEDRYDTIGDTSAGYPPARTADGATIIGCIDSLDAGIRDILFVVYTERLSAAEDGTGTEVTRLISARLATSFEKGLYYGKQS